MKSLRVVSSVIGFAVVGVLFFQVTTHAEDNLPLSEAHKRQIISKCTPITSSLRQLHRSDASLRMNRGQLYEFVGAKLMARLNGRLAVNRLDAGKLIGITASYDKALTSFRDSYRFYEEKLSSLLRIDCVKEPEKFYYAIVDVRTKRNEVKRRVSDLSRLMKEYHEEFKDFSSHYKADPKELQDE